MPSPGFPVCIPIVAALLVAPGFSLASKPEPTRGAYIVHLASPPATLFEGFGAGAPVAKRSLKPTHAATAGRLRFDVEAAEVKSYRGHLAEERAEFQQAAVRALGRPLAPMLSFDLSLNALVMELEPGEAAALAELPEVSRIEPDFVRRPQTDAGPRWINAPALWGGDVGLATKGEGVVIGIIDTGVNASHAAFAQVGPVDGHVHVSPRAVTTPLCLTANTSPCNGKLIGLRDMTTGGSSAEPNNGLDVDGHGTHVASIALGNQLSASISAGSETLIREVSGVAPHAHLISYKACERDADCLGSWTLAAIEAAIADGVDVINYSIGGDPRDPWSSSDALALLAAREAGIVAVVAAGNEGPELGSITSPGNSPWVLSVANTTHNRSIGNRLLDFSGGGGAPPQDGGLIGAGDTIGYGPAQIVVPQDFPGCGVTEGLGLDAAGQPDGSTNPWADNPNRFNGEIVVCLRGTQARLAKGDNVRRAGAGGMILLNTVGDGEDVAADRHVLPATHLGFEAGQWLLQWLQQGGQSARIGGASLIEDARFADRVAGSSGRGPVTLGGVMLPSISAPGTSILGAAGSASSQVVMSGTSMAAPHVAGAAALLRAAKPQWRVNQIQSALMGSARQGLRLADGFTPARRIDGGAGGLDVAAAARAGLMLDVAGADFRAARPALGGQPRDLNLPGLVHESCFERCSLARTVTDLAGGGRWRATVELAEGAVQVSPEEFELSAGGSQRLSFDIDLRDRGGLGRWLDGQVRLTRLSGPGEVGDTVLPLGVFAEPGELPERLIFDVAADAGFIDIEFDGLAGMPQLRAEAGALSTPIYELRSLAQDPTPSSVYDNIGNGSFFSTQRIPAAVVGARRGFLLDASVSSNSARDIALFVGIDYNGNGAPDAGEELCSGKGSGAQRSCKLEILQSGSAQTVWVLVQNVSAGSGAAALDPVRLQVQLLDPKASATGDAVATAPARVAALSRFKVRLSWDDPGFLDGERRVSLLSLRARPELEPFARIPVELRRTGAQAAPRLLVSGREQRLRLAPGDAHASLFIDVPPGSSLLHASISGPAGVTLYASRIPSPTQPQIFQAFAPTTAALIARVDGAPLRVESAQLQSGRWYLTPVNDSGAAVEVGIVATVEHGAQRIQPRFGAWFNPSRAGSGVYLFGFAGNWGLLWYTYLEDGTPTWYIGSAAAPELSQAQWTVPLSRYTWDGQFGHPTVVGEATLSLSDEQNLQFAFSLDGLSGSEPMIWIGSDRCAAGTIGSLDLGGLWYDERNSGFGYSIDASTSLETVGLFFYDDQGMARWSFGSSSAFGAGPLEMLQFSGACPLCDYVPPLTVPIGALLVNYPTTQPGSISASLDLAWPLSGRWDRTHLLDRLSDPMGCVH